MARMYSGKRGKSGSHRPAHQPASWVGYRPEEVEEIAVKLAKKGHSTSEIGMILRDQYGIPSVKAIKKDKLTKLLSKKGIKQEIPEDMMNLLKKAVKLRAHLESRKHDLYSKRGMELTESKIRKLVKYYKSKKTLPEDWKYDPEKAKLLVK